MTASRGASGIVDVKLSIATKLEMMTTAMFNIRSRSEIERDLTDRSRYWRDLALLGSSRSYRVIIRITLAFCTSTLRRLRNRVLPNQYKQLSFPTSAPLQVSQRCKYVRRLCDAELSILNSYSISKNIFNIGRTCASKSQTSFHTPITVETSHSIH